MLGVQLKVPGAEVFLLDVNLSRDDFFNMAGFSGPTEIKVRAALSPVHPKSTFRRVGDPRSAEDIND